MKLGGRKDRPRSPSLTEKGLSSPIAGGSGSDMRSPHLAHSVPSAYGIWHESDRALFACTGDAGKVFRREPTKDAAWTVHFDSSDSQALCLAVCPDETIFVGTGPAGQVVNLTDPKHPSSRPDPKVQYIWDLAADPKGNLYAATGPNGQLWKRASDGKWSLVYDSKATHLLCVAIGPDGSVYAGSDGEGLIYRVATDSKVSILFDAPQSDVRTLVVGWGRSAVRRNSGRGWRRDQHTQLLVSDAGGSGAVTRRTLFGSRSRTAKPGQRRSRTGSGSKGTGPAGFGRAGQTAGASRSSGGLGDSQTDLARR